MDIGPPILQAFRGLSLSSTAVPVPTVPPILPPIVNPAELLCPKSRYGHKLLTDRGTCSDDCCKRRCTLCGWNRPFLLIKCGCNQHWCRYSITWANGTYGRSACLDCGKRGPEGDPSCNHDFRPRVSNDQYRVNQGFDPCTHCGRIYIGYSAC